MRVSTILSLAAALLAVSGARAEPGPSGDAGRVPGELIVGFEGSSAARRAVTTAMAGLLERDPALIDYVAELSRRIGLPVRASRVTSGGEVLLELDSGALASRLAEAAGRAPGIAAVTSRRTDAGPFTAHHQVRVRFAAGSAEARALAAASRGRPPAGMDEWLSGLAAESGLELSARADRGELALEVDLRWATEELMRRLARQSEVAYVEPNRLMQPQ